MDRILTELIKEQKLRRRGLIVHSPDHQIKLSETDSQLWDALHPILSPSSGSPPSLHQAAEQVKAEVRTLEGFLKRGARAGLVVQIARNRYVPVRSAQTLARMAETLGASIEDGRFTAAEFRDCSGLGRNFAIDLLEFFDRIGFTERAGDVRRIKQSAANLFGDGQ